MKEAIEALQQQIEYLKQDNDYIEALKHPYISQEHIHYFEGKIEGLEEAIEVLKNL